MSSVYQRFASIKELHDIPDVPPPEQGLTEIEEYLESEEETILLQEEFGSGMNPPLPGKNFELHDIPDVPPPEQGLTEIEECSN